jgi:cystathionine gamma-synthase
VVATNIGVVFFPVTAASLAKNYWQHSGEGISSRLAEYLLKALFDQQTGSQSHSIKFNPVNMGASKSELQARRIQALSPSLGMRKPKKDESMQESELFIDQKYGRILDLKFGEAAKVALRKRIIGNFEISLKQVQSDLNNGSSSGDKDAGKLNFEDVYLYPSGMAAIFNAHVALLQSTEAKKSVCFGFPYVDTLNILKKFGPGVHFLGLGDDASLEDLENKLETGEYDIMALFCECPSNPLLKTPNLKKIRQLADKYKFAVVIDDTIGNLVNIHVLPYADMVATSLTKIFSGDSDVMGGSLVLNDKGPMYSTLKAYFDKSYENTFWVQDALVMERNSRDYATRAAKVNRTTLAMVKFLVDCPLISKVYYPTVLELKKYYDEIKTPNGGYGGLVSFLFHEPADAVAFFNAMNFHKGPSLGTNFTLACPYSILAHYQELDEIEKWDVDRNLIRVSVGIEDEEEILAVLQESMDATIKAHQN